MKNLLPNVKRFIADGSTNEALEKLHEFLGDRDHPLHDDVIVLQAENKQTEKMMVANTICHEVAQRRMNRTNMAILKLLDLMECKTLKRLSILRKIKRPTKGIIKIFLILCIALASIPYALQVDYDGKVAQLVLEDLAADLYNDYKDVYLNGVKIKNHELRIEVKAFIQKLELIEEEDIELHSKIYRNLGLAISNKILALTTLDPIDQMRYASRGLEIIEKLEKQLVIVENLKDKNYQEELNEWLKVERHPSRILMNKFILLAINSRASKLPNDELNVCYRKLKEDGIIEAEGYHVYPIVQWYRNFYDNCC